MADIVSQAVINALTKALEDGSVDPTSELGKSYLKIISGFQSTTDTAERSKQKKIDAKKDAKTKESIAKKKAQIAIAEANKQNTDQLKLELDTLRKEIIDPTDPERFGSEIRYGVTGESLVPGSAEFKAGKVKTPTTPTTVLPDTGIKTSFDTTTGKATEGVNVSTGGKTVTTGGKTVSTKGKKTPYTIDEIYSLVAQNYGPIDLIFKSNPELKELLLKSIGKDQVPGTSDDYTADQFTKMLENTSWFKSNASAIRQRGFYKRQYDELRKTTDDLASLDRTSEYGRGLTATKQRVADAAKTAGISLDADTLDLVARDIYDLGYENTPAIIQQQIRARLKYKPGQVLGGTAGEQLQALKATAAANGLDLEKNFGTQLQTWLQNINQGESVETYKQIIRGAAKLGLPDKVGSLLDLGVDLDTVYQPYKNIMYQVLEVNPETINVNDATLRKAIGPDKEMSLYEWQDFLKKDPRWQYTNNARESAYDAAKTVLKDFGMIGG